MMRFSLHHGRFALTTQLILAFLTVSLIPLALLAFLNERDTRAVLTDHANRSLAAAAEQTTAGIDAFIRDNLDAARREAHLPTFVRYLSLPVVERVGSSEEEAVLATLNELRRRDKVFISTYALLDRQGKNVVDTNPEHIGRDESAHDYFQKPLETGLPYLSAPRFERQSENQAGKWNEAVLYFSAPVYLGQDTIGVLRFRYQATILQQLVVKHNGLAGEQSFAILFDENQIRLAHGSAPELIFKLVVPLEPKRLRTLQAVGRLPNWTLEDLSTNLPPLADGLDNLLFQANFTTPLDPTGDGLNLAIGQELQTQPWVVLFMQPQDVFLAPIEDQTQATLLLAIVIGGVVVATAFVVGRVLAQPIVQLTETVTQFTTGDLDARTEIKRADELGQLADTFNAMAEQLKEAFATLQASEQKYRDIFEYSKELIYLTTLDGQVLDVNPVGESLLGYSREALLSMNARDFYVNPLDPLRFQQEIEKHRSVKDFEVELLRQDGTKIECSVTATLRQAEDGTPLGYQGIIRDISQRKQHEKLLQEYNRTLEEEVSARTAQLAEATREAEQAQTEAEAANRAKSVFLGNMSHELRTPLNAILGFAQLISRSQTLPPQQQENLAIIRRGGEDLLTLVNNLLDLSKIQVGRMTLNLTSFDLYQLLDELEEMFFLAAEEKGLQLIFERTPDVPQYVCTDSVKLRQVLINLLGNALKFTAQGSVSVHVRKAHKKEVLLLQVEDTGEGIAPDELDQLFEAFMETGNGNKAQQGAGLGLPISYQFVRLMGGEMSVETQVGRGTTFKICAQLHKVDTRQIKEAQPTRRVIALEPNQPRYRILIVDDKWSNRLLLISLLNPLGFSLKEASNGKEAIALWQEWEPHLIWMDMRMPVMDGYEATKRIKQTTKGQATAIIALTASTLEEEQAVILSSGCDDFLRKPFRSSDIFNLMDKHIGVRYIYGEDEDQDEHQSRLSSTTLTQQKALTPAALAALPTSLLAELQAAVGGSDIEMMEQVLAQISQLDPALANQLTALADDFEYDEILQLLEEAKVVDLLG